MKQCFSLLIAMLITGASFAQIKNPVKWAFTAKKISATTYEVHLAASLENGWHIYSQTTPEGGPVATAISFAKNPLLTISGQPKEIGKLELKHEPLFGVDVKQFSKTVDFVQTVTIKGKAKTSVTGSVEFLTCNDRECLPPATQKFSVKLQ